MIKNINLKNKNKKDTYYMPNWIDINTKTKYFKDTNGNKYKRELNIPLEGKILLYSGSMNEKQGLETLVDVFELLNDIPNLFMILAGEGQAKNKILDLTKNISNIINLPLQPEERFIEFLNLADIHLLPQKRGVADYLLPSKLLGIMASAKAVVASSPKNSELGNIADLVGIRVDPGDIKQFAGAIRMLLSNPLLAEKKGQSGLNYVIEHHNKEIILNNFLKESSLLFKE